MTHTTSSASNLEPGICSSVEAEMPSERRSDRAFVGISASLFAISAALTTLWCASMSDMQGMSMPGGWTMSMMWMRMPGQTWIEASASFLAMWVAMMAAMMMPSHVPMLWRYRQAVRSRGESRLGRLTLLAGLGYFVVWSLFGLAVFPLGVVLAIVEMKYSVLAHAVPTTGGMLILIAGAVQLTSWKAHHLARCRELPARGRTIAEQATTAWRQGVRFGLHCSLSCANLTAILLVIGLMDLRAMAVITAAITAERLAPAGERVAQATGAVVIVAGVLLLARVSFLR
jgi:predicted metal-binding membrane protein